MSDLTERRAIAKQQFVDAFAALLAVDIGQTDRKERGITILSAFQEAWAHNKTSLDDDERREFARVMDAVHNYEQWSATGEIQPSIS